MGIVIERKWRCESCDAIHDTEDSAIDCCQTDPKQIQEDDGKRFPKAGAHMSTAEYLAAYCELNKVKT